MKRKMGRKMWGILPGWWLRRTGMRSGSITPGYKAEVSGLVMATDSRFCWAFHWNAIEQVSLSLQRKVSSACPGRSEPTIPFFFFLNDLWICFLRLDGVKLELHEHQVLSPQGLVINNYWTPACDIYEIIYCFFSPDIIIKTNGRM